MANIYQNGKVLLAKFSVSEEMKADNAGKSTSRLDDFYRVKTYVKPKYMVNPDYPVFPQPYQLAQYLFGGTWNCYNSVFIVQVAACPLRCWYCYVPQELMSGLEQADGVELGRWFSAEEIIEMWHESGESKVLRISGGEPTLAPELLVELIDRMEEEKGLLWIDTNLATGDAFLDAYKSSVAALEYHPNVALSGCFKGFCDSDAADATGMDWGLLDRQFKMASKLVGETDLEMFFYVPGIVHGALAEPKYYIKEFFNRMRKEVDEMAPLRTYILEVHSYASTDKSGFSEWDSLLPDGSRPVDYWKELCEEHYAPELLWLPNHQIAFQRRQ